MLSTMVHRLDIIFLILTLGGSPVPFLHFIVVIFRPMFTVLERCVDAIPSVSFTINGDQSPKMSKER